MSTGWIVILGLFAGVYVLKATGPLLLGGRALPVVVQRAANLLPAALLGGIVAVSTFGAGPSALAVDARLAGVVAAAVALWRKQSFVVVVIVAAAATAVVRALS